MRSEQSRHRHEHHHQRGERLDGADQDPEGQGGEIDDLRTDGGLRRQVSYGCTYVDHFPRTSWLVVENLVNDVHIVSHRPSWILNNCTGLGQELVFQTTIITCFTSKQASY